MPHVEIIEVPRYYPPGVSEIIGRGGECFVGAIDEFTGLKYPCIPSNCESIQIEAQLLEALGSHPHIITLERPDRKWTPPTTRQQMVLC